MTLQRLRIRYRKTAAADGIQPGQLARNWVKAFTAAGMPAAQPDGARRPRLELGPALPQGAVGEREPLDVWLEERAEPCGVCERLRGHLPDGIEPHVVEEIGDRLPSLGASVRSATYRVLLPTTAVDAPGLQAAIDDLMGRSTLHWVEVRGERVRGVDLRAQVLALGLLPPEPEAASGSIALRMRLVANQDQTGRPATVLAALGVEAGPLTFIREDVEVGRPLIAIGAWRSKGRFQ